MPCDHEERLCETMLQSKYFIACELVKSACELENAREEIARLKKTIHVIVEEAAKRALKQVESEAMISANLTSTPPNV